MLVRNKIQVDNIRKLRDSSAGCSISNVLGKTVSSLVNYLNNNCPSVPGINLDNIPVDTERDVYILNYIKENLTLPGDNAKYKNGKRVSIGDLVAYTDINLQRNMFVVVDIISNNKIHLQNIVTLEVTKFNPAVVIYIRSKPDPAFNPKVGSVIYIDNKSVTYTVCSVFKDYVAVEKNDTLKIERPNLIGVWLFSKDAIQLLPEKQTIKPFDSRSRPTVDDIVILDIDKVGVTMSKETPGLVKYKVLSVKGDTIQLGNGQINSIETRDINLYKVIPSDINVQQHMSCDKNASATDGLSVEEMELKLLDARRKELKDKIRIDKVNAYKTDRDTLDAKRVELSELNKKLTKELDKVRYNLSSIEREIVIINRNIDSINNDISGYQCSGKYGQRPYNTHRS